MLRVCGEWGDGAVIAKVCSVSLCGGKNVVKLTVVMVTYITKYTKTH